MSGRLSCHPVHYDRSMVSDSKSSSKNAHYSFLYGSSQNGLDCAKRSVLDVHIHWAVSSCYIEHPHIKRNYHPEPYFLCR